jgi:hypothetical protein
MNAPARAVPAGFKLVFVIGAVVVFILAALFGFGVGDIKLDTILGLIAAGLAVWAASTIVP